MNSVYKFCLIEFLATVLSREYEDLAYEILTRCENLTEGDDTSDLLVRISPSWGHVSHLQLAEATESRKFMSNPAVQTLLRKIWREGLDVSKDSGDVNKVLKTTHQS